VDRRVYQKACATERTGEAKTAANLEQDPWKDFVPTSRLSNASRKRLTIRMRKAIAQVLPNDIK